MFAQVSVECLFGFNARLREYVFNAVFGLVVEFDGTEHRIVVEVTVTFEFNTIIGQYAEDSSLRDIKEFDHIAQGSTFGI